MELVDGEKGEDGEDGDDRQEGGKEDGVLPIFTHTETAVEAVVCLAELEAVRLGQVELEVMLREVQVASGAQKSRIVLL